MAAPALRAEASAPGKVILHGEHAVVFGRPALAASLGLRTTAAVQEEEPADEPLLRLQLPCVALEAAVPLRAVEERVCAATRGARAWAEPRRVQHERVLGAVDEFVAAGVDGAATWSGAQRDAVRALLYLWAGVLGDEGAARRDVRVRVSGELPVGAGAGSSAAFAVCAAAALLQLRRLRAGERAPAFGAEERALVSAWAFNCERIAHGAPSGVDNATCTFGGVVSFRRGAEVRALRLRARLRVLLVDSRVGRQTSALTRHVSELRARLPRVVDCVVEACGHVADEAAQILERLPGDGDADALYRRLAELWDANHCLLAALGVSHAALEDIRRIAALHKLAAKLTGAGGGGNAIVLLPPATAEEVVRALSDELRRAGYGVSDAQLGGDGVRLHAPGGDGVRLHAPGGDGVRLHAPGGDGVRLHAPGGDGVRLHAPGGDGVRLHAPGGDGVRLHAPGGDGVRLHAPGGDGVRLHAPGGDGVRLHAPGGDGVRLHAPGGDGVRLHAPGGDGVRLHAPGGDGVRLHAPGGDGVRLHAPGGDGVRLHAPGGDGVRLHAPGGDGVRLHAPGGDGVRLHAPGGDGVRLHAPGGDGVRLHAPSGDVLDA